MALKGTRHESHTLLGAKLRRLLHTFIIVQFLPKVNNQRKKGGKALLKDNLARYRTKAGLSQSDLAKKVGCTQQMIYLCEKGLKIPSLAVAAEMAKSLECTVDDLIRD